MKVELEKSAAGDWDRLIVGGKTYYEGHSIPTRVWMDLCAELGATTEQREVPSEDYE